MKTRSGSQNLQSTSSTQQPIQQHQMKTRQRGNLDNVLNDYDASGTTSGQHAKMQEEEPSLLTIQIPTGARIQPVPTPNEADERNRSSTFGSEFDMSWVKERGMSLSCLLTPMGEEEGGLPSHVTGVTTAHLKDENATTVSTSSNGPMHHNHDDVMPSLGERGGNDTDEDFMFETEKSGGQQQKMVISHTPPSNVATSYEQRHFQKRMRAGSISGRLRSASDLEDIGIISNDQKAILKDLLIAGNDKVQAAIDKYEAGDSSALEEMISSGAFSTTNHVDLLGDLDLDLDFLNVHEEMDDDLVFGNMDDMHHDGSGQQKRVGRAVKSDDAGDHDGDDAFSRIRTNSLALPGMTLDGANQDYSLGDFGHWMDSDLPNLMNHSSARHAPPSSDTTMLNADGSSSSFKLQCDLLMQKEGDHGYASSPMAVKSILMDNHTKPKQTIIPPKKPPQASQPNLKKKSKSKKADSSDGKKSKKKSSGPNEAYSTESIPFIKREKGGDDDSDDNKEVPSGLGRPRSMSDPNLDVRLDERGLLHVQGPKGWVGAYSPDSREMRIKKFLEKRNHRVWVKKVKYDVRKNFADSRLRVKGRFVKKEDEMLMRELMSLT